jgi:nucleotide-binding universal stress UspA family protein
MVKTLVAEGHASDRIVEITKEQNHDLIVMGSHGYRGVNKAILGSTTERVILDASCPILIVR